MTAVVLLLLPFGGSAFANGDHLETARGIGFALVVSEKCTGIAPPSEYIPRIRSIMTSAGMPDDDFRQGFASGAMSAEMRFRGKPPVKECKDAKRMKAILDKAVL